MLSNFQKITLDEPLQTILESLNYRHTIKQFFKHIPEARHSFPTLNSSAQTIIRHHSKQLTPTLDISQSHLNGN